MPLVAAPGDTELFLDFDGTLAAICDDPAAADMSESMRAALESVLPLVRRVSVVSGRPVSFLSSRVPPQVDLFGLYGLEWVVDGRVGELADASVWREVVAGAVADGIGRFGSDVIEDKGVSLTAHYRRRPELETSVVAWVEQQAAESGLVERPAKMSCELHPPIEVDKGSVVLEQAASTAVVFIGDDIGDLPGFRALETLSSRGIETLGVVVRTEETPAELLEIADLSVSGADGVVALLEGLAGRGQLIG